jgi:nucleotide-binding universal stress UspA family protein
MISVVVIPGQALGRARPLARALGWQLEPAPTASGRDLEAFVGENRSLLVVPEGARVPRSLRRILLPHEGTPAVALGLEVADRLAVVTGAEIVVVHVPSADVPSERGSLPAPRFTDQPHHDWPEWRREFIRRFCRSSEGVSLTLALATGPLSQAILEGARQHRADLVVMTWRREAGARRARTLKAVTGGASCPVLVGGGQGGRE